MFFHEVAFADSAPLTTPALCLVDELDRGEPAGVMQTGWMTAASSLAVVGAGPVGIDAAIAGVEGGYAVTVYEQGPAVAANVREWGHVQLFTPWDMSLSSRARRRVPGLPVGQACPSGAELAQVVQRLASSLPPGTVRLGTRVDSIARSGVVKSDEIGTGRRAGRPFRLLLSGPGGAETIESADIVLDCTGSYAVPNALGDGGMTGPW